MKNALVCFMAIVCSFSTFTSVGHCQRQTDQMGFPYHRIAGDYQQGSGSGWVPQARQWEPKESSRAKPDESSFQRSLRRLYNGRLTRPTYEVLTLGSTKTPISQQVSTASGLVDFTPKLIKKRGDEKKNYVVMISADWCHWCKKMYPLVKELRKKGYIIYVFETNRPEFRNYAALYNVRAYPTFIVYDKGKEVDRTSGKTNKDWFTKRLKIKDDQQKKKPADPYDGI